MKKIVSLLMAFVLFVGFAATATAAPAPGDTAYGDWNGTVNGKPVVINKYLVTNKEASVPNVTFTYTLTIPGDGTEGKVVIPADTTAGKPNVYAGIGVENILVMADSVYDDAVPSVKGTMTFNGGDATTDGPKDVPVITDKEKYVPKAITIDFSDVEFTEPGIYRYYLQEASDNDLVINDTEVDGTNKTWRTIDVYVTDDQTDDHKLNWTSVVYEGKLTTAPYNDASDYDESVDYDPTRDLSGLHLTGTTWTYEVPDSTVGEKYEYNYVDGAWEEKHTINASQSLVEINRNRTDHLQDALGSPEGVTLTTDLYSEAKAMGASDALLRSKTWAYTDARGEVHTYVWDTDQVPNVWRETATLDYSADKPHDDARATVTIFQSGSTEQREFTYKDAKEMENYIDGELTKYTWKLTESGSGKVTTYSWNSQTETWDAHEEVNNTTNVVPNGAAKSKTGEFAVNPVKFSYVEGKEKAAQSAAGTTQDPNGAEAGVKTDRYVNKYEAYNLKITKKVTGNQGSRDQYFKFTITLKKIDADADIKFINQDATTTSLAPDQTVAPNAATNPDYTIETIIEANTRDDDTNTAGAQIKPNADKVVEMVVYLRHGEAIELKDIPMGSEYQVVEVDGNGDGYTTITDLWADDQDQLDSGGGGSQIPYGDGIADIWDDYMQSDVQIDFVNDRSGIIPTGIVMSVAGGAAIVALAGVGLVAINRKKRDEDEYED